MFQKRKHINDHVNCLYSLVFLVRSHWPHFVDTYFSCNNCIHMYIKYALRNYDAKLSLHWTFSLHRSSIALPGIQWFSERHVKILPSSSTAGVKLRILRVILRSSESGCAQKQEFVIWKDYKYSLWCNPFKLISKSITNNNWY